MAQKITDMVHVHIIRMTPDYPWPESVFTDISIFQLAEYRKQIYEEIKDIDWSKIDDKYTHLVFYSDLRDEGYNVYYATLYLNGAKEYCTEEYFKDHYGKNPRQFTIAVHRP